MAEHLKDRPDIKKVATIAPDYEFGQHFVQDFLAHLKAVRPDIVVVRQEWPKLGATDFAAHVTALQATIRTLVNEFGQILGGLTTESQNVDRAAAALTSASALTLDNLESRREAMDV